MKAQFGKDHQYFASPGEAVARQSPADPIHSHYCYLTQTQTQEESLGLGVVIQAQVQVPDHSVEAVEAQASVPEAEVVEFVVYHLGRCSSWLRSTGARLRIGRLSVPFP
ncbi:hypothetical protein PspLS_01676 [Pyricularia sp. CBS 133598]|nr:hypothetical protein PspLS_01676 [Pyricularia sp. CBS 133598]